MPFQRGRKNRSLIPGIYFLSSRLLLQRWNTALFSQRTRGVKRFPPAPLVYLVKWWFVVELLKPIHIISHEIVPEAWIAAGNFVRKRTASFSAAVLGGYFSLLKSAWTPSTDQCRKLISCISWHKYVSSALTFCTTAPKGQSMPTMHDDRFAGLGKQCKRVWESCIFTKLSVWMVCDIFTYLFICAGITSRGVDATTPELHLSPSGQRLGSPDYNLSVTVFLPSRTHLPCPLCWTLPCNALAQDTLIVLGRKITLCFSSLRRDWTAYSTAQQFLSLGKQNAIKISHYSSF